jgi:hypothetical protein
MQFFYFHLHRSRQMYAELLQKAQSTLSLSLPTTGTTPQGANFLPNIRENFAHISFWTQKEWTSYKSKQQNDGVLAGDQGVKPFDFIESEDGIPVSGERIKAITRGCRELFQSIRVMWEQAGRKAPETWGKMTHGNKELYRQKIKALYPELAFCEGDWKCEALATNLYPGWYRNHIKAPDHRQQSKVRVCSSKSPTPAPIGVPEHSRSPSVPTGILESTPGCLSISAVIPPALTPTPKHLNVSTVTPVAFVPTPGAGSIEHCSLQAASPTTPAITPIPETNAHPDSSGISNEIIMDSDASQGFTQAAVSPTHSPSPLPLSPYPESYDPSPEPNPPPGAALSPVWATVAAFGAPAVSIQGETTHEHSIQVSHGPEIPFLSLTVPLFLGRKSIVRFHHLGTE